MSLNNKIPCKITVFFEFDIIKKSLDYFIKFADRLEITVVENKSKNTESLIKPYILQLLKEKKIYQYILFDKNITSNASIVIYKKNLIPQTNSPYFITSDGDLICDNDSWLDEEISIMEQNKEVFAVGVDLTTVNLPKVPNAENWVKKATEIANKNYNQGSTGAWFLMYRRQEYNKCLDYLISKFITPIDSKQHQYCSKISKIWARTKQAQAYHLTWDLYQDDRQPYTQYKKSKSFKQHWQHDKYCNYTVYKLGSDDTIQEEKYYSFSLIHKVQKFCYRIKRFFNLINIFYGV